MQQDDFAKPIVRALAQLDGSAYRQDVIATVKDLVDLSTKDREELSDGSPRWQKHIDFMVLKMRGDLIKSTDHSQKGIWELTEEGWSYAQQIEQWGTD